MSKKETNSSSKKKKQYKRVEDSLFSMLDVAIGAVKELPGGRNLAKIGMELNKGVSQFAGTISEAAKQFEKTKDLKKNISDLASMKIDEMLFGKDYDLVMTDTDVDASCSFSGTFSNMYLIRSKISRTRFNTVTMENSTFINCTISGSLFSLCRFRECKFQNVIFEDIAMAKIELKGLVLKDEEFIGDAGHDRLVKLIKKHDSGKNGSSTHAKDN